MKSLVACAVLGLAGWLAAVPLPASPFAAVVKNAKGALVADAVIALVPLDGAPLPPPTGNEIPQRDQEFTEYVTVVQSGARVLFPNRDSVQHHVYSLSKAKKFELPLYNPGQSESFVFDVSGVVTLGCNIHDWMVAYLFVVPTPYFAKTDHEGSASVAAPPGRYRVDVMHPLLAKTISAEITLPGETVPREFVLTLKADRRVRRGVDGKSGGYR
jgi:hypothetical protein